MNAYEGVVATYLWVDIAGMNPHNIPLANNYLRE